jgi:hypothetical protein
VSSDVADAALVDLGVLAQCDAQETLCPDDDLEPRELTGNMAAARGLRRPGEGYSDVIFPVHRFALHQLYQLSGEHISCAL